MTTSFLVRSASDYYGIDPRKIEPATTNGMGLLSKFSNPPSKLLRRISLKTLYIKSPSATYIFFLGRDCNRAGLGRAPSSHSHTIPLFPIPVLNPSHGKYIFSSSINKVAPEFHPAPPRLVLIILLLIKKYFFICFLSVQIICVSSATKHHDP